MKIIYTANIPEVRKQDACYRDSFLGVISGATSIEIDDDFPDADLVDQAYAFLGAQPLTATVSVGLTPELQAVLDEAKAECEKVVAENDALKAQVVTLQADLDTSRSELTSGEPMDLTGYIPFEQFDAVARKLTETEDQLKVAQAEIVTLKTPKKPTAAELKATKAAEEAKAAEQQPQE